MSRSVGVNFRARARFGNPTQHNERQGMQIDWLIDLREKLLDKLSGVQANDALNDSAAGSIPDFGTEPAAGLKRALDKIKSTAVDDSGVHVDYAALRTSAAYQEFRTMCSPRLRTFDPAGLASREEQMAFWINLYNALVMDAVIAFDVQRSVAEGHLGQLTFFRRAAYNVAGQRVSLDDIEHGILRANRGHPFLPGPHFTSKDARLPWVITLDPRVHFALNCASRSCPPIQVYSVDQLEVQLDLAARNFVDSNVKISPAKQVLIVSSILQWFKGDFGGRDGIVSFLIDHLPFDRRRAWLSKKQDAIKLSYEPYDWRINTSE